MKAKLQNCRIVTLAMLSAVALSFVTIGCDREISRTENTKVKSDGSVETKEKTVKENPDGTVTKTEDTKKTTPEKP